jgi:F-type H+-transporting ATPase subunit a
MEHVLWITRQVNHFLGPLASALLAKLQIPPTDPNLPIPQQVVMGMLVVLFGTVLALIIKSRLSVEKPGSLQQAAELLLTNPMSFGIKDLLEENVHHGAIKMIPFVGSISIFVLLGNLMGAFPSSLFVAPTGQVTVPLACAILTFLYFNFHGFAHHGIGKYILTFAGSPRTVGDWILAILLFPVELISTSARLLSLTVRLWANMYASDLIYAIFLGLLTTGTIGFREHPFRGSIFGIAAALVPVLFIGLHIFVAVVQAYVFTVLPAVYLGMATADEH